MQDKMVTTDKRTTSETEAERIRSFILVAKPELFTALTYCAFHFGSIDTLQSTIDQVIKVLTDTANLNSKEKVSTIKLGLLTIQQFLEMKQRKNEHEAKIKILKDLIAYPIDDESVQIARATQTVAAVQVEASKDNKTTQLA